MDAVLTAVRQPRGLGQYSNGNEHEKQVDLVPLEHIHATLQKRRGSAGFVHGCDSPNGHQAFTPNHLLFRLEAFGLIGKLAVTNV